MADWLVEEGIGEQRAVRLRDGRIAAARLLWPGRLMAGQVEDAVLTHRAKGSRRGTITFASGEEALVDRLPSCASEGASLRCLVTRAALAERDRRKMAQAVPSEDDCRPAPGLAAQLRQEGCGAQVVRRFPEGDWDELWLEAWAGTCQFEGGELAFFDTSAMTLVDVDGSRDPRTLALRAVPALVDAIGRFDLSGSIGIDFPTLPDKADRKAVDAALDGALRDWPHERTAMNGFGFVQIVARCERPSILRALQRSPGEAAVRLLLRKAENVGGHGPVLLCAHPAVIDRIALPWQEELARRTGRAIHLSSDTGLALEAGFAQAEVP